ncbi:MAG TPA: copper resistance protein CopC [Solirubrobacteraceae bacterium]|nr:copper resistance protein CopC [Solirubrobacteraceae bacterium]
MLRKFPLQATVALAVACVLAASASAHAPIASRTPAPATAAHNVRTVQITFGDSVVTGLIEVRCGGRLQSPAASGPTHHNTIVRASFSKPLPPGSCTVNWRALAKDGHHQRGSWTFTVRGA